jgi:hypothetical protein
MLKLTVMFKGMKTQPDDVDIKLQQLAPKVYNNKIKCDI